ncbi:MAG TPA: thioesterase family protein, partial [Acidimicrobiia bacterium]
SFHEGTETMAFVNADLMVSLHRPPHGTWIGSHTVSFWEPNGIGRADAELFDDTGPVGRAMQSLVLRRLS